MKSVLLALLIVGFTASASVLGQRYPERPIKLVVPYPPSGAADLLGRTVSQKLGENLGQPVLVENRGGAGGALGSELVSRASPDGYTLLLGASQTHAIAKSLVKHLNYDPVKDFTPLTAAVEVPIALVVQASFAPNTARELVEYAKKHPGKVSFGSSGPGSPHHLAGELLNQVTGIDMVHVPYKGGGPALQDLMGGRIPAVFTTLSAALSQRSSGKLKLLAVVEARRQPSAPDVPTIGESVPEYAMPRSWFGFFGPPGMAAARVKRLNAELVRALHEPGTRARLESAGMPVIGTSAEELAGMVASDLEMYRRIITTAGIQPE